MVIPSIFAIDDADGGSGDDKYPPRIALSPIVSTNITNIWRRWIILKYALLFNDR